MKNLCAFKKIAKGLILSVLFLFSTHAGWSQANSYTFTPAGATGSLGPTQTMVNNSYSLTNLNGSVTVLGQGIQQFTIPVTGPYKIEAWGGQGYGSFGGRGARMAGDFTLTAGTVLKIAVGQQGGLPQGSSNQFGGGGGSFVTYTNNVPLVVAGGGGGSWATSFQANSDGTVVTTGNSGMNGAGGNGAGGTNGSGGMDASLADGGGGLTGNGSAGAGGLAFVNGATGGSNRGQGGFGGGGGTSSWDNYRGGGGGGYSGGGGSAGNTTAGSPQAGGGGSYNNGVNQNNASGVNLGDGKVIITELCPLSITASGSNSLHPILCAGQSLTLTTNGISNFNWSTGNTTSSVIVVSPNVTTTYTISATHSLNCTTSAVITVTVSAGPPVLTVNSSTNNLCLGSTATLTATGALTYTWSNSVQNGVSFTPQSTNTYTVQGENGCGITTAMTTITVSPLQVPVITSSSLVCALDVATLTASGANTYTWSVGSQTFNTGAVVPVSPSLQTVYTVTGEIGGCIGTNTIMISTKPNPTLNITASNFSVCENSTISLVVTGADTYTWIQSGLTGSNVVTTVTAPTLYQVTGTSANNCTASAQQIALTISAPTISAIASPPTICPGGSSSLQASGAVTYAWTGMGAGPTQVVNPSSSTIYTLTGTDNNNCSSTVTIQVNVVPNNLTATSNVATVCPNAPAILTASGGANYSWSSGGTFSMTTVTPATSSVYVVSATTSSNAVTCTVSASVPINVFIPDPVTITSVPNRTVICRGRDQFLLTASGSNSYQWSTGATTNTITLISGNPALTTFTIESVGTDLNGCVDTAAIAFFVSRCEGINELGIQQITIYPNPNSGQFTVENYEPLTMQIINELGQLVLEEKLVDIGTHQLDLGEVAPGVYFIKSIGKQGNSIEKFMVR